MKPAGSIGSACRCRRLHGAAWPRPFAFGRRAFAAKTRFGGKAGAARISSKRLKLRKWPELPRPYVAEVASALGPLAARLALRRLLRAWRGGPPPRRRGVRALRANRRKPPQDLLRRLHTEGLRPSPAPWGADSFLCQEESEKLSGWREHHSGEIYLQELSSMLPVEVLKLCGLEPSSRCLDLCAAPGSKATQLALNLEGDGLLVANEVDPQRAQVLRCNLVKSGASDRCLILQEDGRRLGALAPSCFDAVLLDAPCSAEGNLTRHKEVLQRMQGAGYGALKARNAELQWGLLRSGWRLLRGGGVLVYSTCTLNSEENEAVLARLLAEERVELIDVGARLGIETAAPYLRLWPQLLGSNEGFFVACLRKGPEHAAPVAESSESGPWRPLAPEVVRGLRSRAKLEYGYWPDLTDEECAERVVQDMSGDIYLAPSPRALEGLERLLPLAAPGLRLGPELRLAASGAGGSDPLALSAQLGGGLGPICEQMDRAAKAGDWRKATVMFSDIQRQRLQADLIAYNTLVKVQKSVPKIWAVLREMRKSLVQADGATFGAAMQAAAGAGDLDASEQLFQEMGSVRLQPDIIIHTMRIGACCAAGRRGEAEAALAELRAARLRPDAASCTALLDLYARQGDVPAAERLVLEMDAANVVSYTVLLKAYLAKDRLEDAERLLDTMKAAEQLPNLISYTPLLSAFAKRGRVQEAQGLVRRMEREHLAMDMVSYGALLLAHARARDAEGALQVLRRMAAERLAPNAVCCQTAQAAGGAKREWLLSEMRRQRLEPTSAEPGAGRRPAKGAGQNAAKEKARERGRGSLP
ncbi:unnamed protein product [Effrenium voratum]|nr:unnamed protein product [Effrenium voratum]